MSVPMIRVIEPMFDNIVVGLQNEVRYLEDEVIQVAINILSNRKKLTFHLNKNLEIEGEEYFFKMGQNEYIKQICYVSKNFLYKFEERAKQTIANLKWKCISVVVDVSTNTELWDAKEGENDVVGNKNLTLRIRALQAMFIESSENENAFDTFYIRRHQFCIKPTIEQ